MVLFLFVFFVLDIVLARCYFSLFHVRLLFFVVSYGSCDLFVLLLCVLCCCSCYCSLLLFLFVYFVIVLIVAIARVLWYCSYSCYCSL